MGFLCSIRMCGLALLLDGDVFGLVKLMIKLDRTSSFQLKYNVMNTISGHYQYHHHPNLFEITKERSFHKPIYEQ